MYVCMYYGVQEISGAEDSRPSGLSLPLDFGNQLWLWLAGVSGPITLKPLARAGRLCTLATVLLGPTLHSLHRLQCQCPRPSVVPYLPTLNIVTTQHTGVRPWPGLCVALCA